MLLKIEALLKKDQVYGEAADKENVVLAELDDDLTKDQSWSDLGFSTHAFLKQDIWKKLLAGFEDLIKGALEEVGIDVPEGFEVIKYHTLVPWGDDRHLEIINKTKLFHFSQFPVDFSIVEQRISEILGFKVDSLKPFNAERVFHFRIVRPGASDYNPLHRDVWQDENKDAINIYVPLWGSNDVSSLKLVPGSHLWTESETTRTKEGAQMNGLKFNVPGLISSESDLQLIRPNPKENEVLVFSPYLLHGLSENGNSDGTRISLEMRFWRA